MKNDSARRLKSKTANRLVETLGWVGVLLIFSAFSLNSLGYLGSQSATYSVLNIIGSIGILVDAYNQRNYQPAVLNLLWAAVGILALARLALAY